MAFPGSYEQHWTIEWRPVLTRQNAADGSGACTFPRDEAAMPTLARLHCAGCSPTHISLRPCIARFAVPEGLTYVTHGKKASFKRAFAITPPSCIRVSLVA
ncbi:hypothetical protein PsYK624_085710 [Phanerochaete sordida]|uniref:Uncharacterized protein n=1 Tax=Phanerochaete sordida TaxID=48140 RepID=A0A9P3GD10_9APHY|nr:hypothetical protein PsYK624_085710 [Phanerochaete sordida]